MLEVKERMEQEKEKEEQKKKEEEEEEVYRTWPNMRKACPARDVTASVSAQHLPSTQPMSMAAALESLNISYSPAGKCLQPSLAVSVESDENEAGNVYYKPGHRKAYSLPRTLEGVDENGTISHPVVEHDVVVESPRTTIQRYGLQYQHWRDHRDCGSSVSEDSGVFSASQLSENLSEERPGPPRPRLGEIIRSGLAANLRLLGRSGQQVAARLVRREAEAEADSLGETLGPLASSQSLIMERRPPGVPCKTPAEEEKHRAEHSQILQKMKRREWSEGRDRAQRRADQRRTEDDLSQLASHWQTTVIPAWASQAHTKKTRALWWRGLPPPVRGRVWRLALPNTLNLTAQLYQILVSRATQQLSSGQQLPGGPGCSREDREDREETLELIRLDVSRTFPQLCIFQEGGPYFQLLHNVLGAYVCYRPDIGYVQGMSFIAAILILNMDEADAFITFANLLNWPQLAAFFCMSEAEMSSHYSSFSALLLSHLPALAAHFTRLGLRPDLYLLDWLMTVFSRALPLDVACRIWDIIARDGQDFLFKAALGILALYEERLLAETDFVLIAQFLSKLPDNINSDLLFDKIEGLSVSASKRTFPSLSLW